jgi:hypothetical protein
MGCISEEEKKCLYEGMKHELGAPTRSVELTDEQLDTFLKYSIEDYAEHAQNWLIDHQWSSLLGKSVSHIDLVFAMTTRSLDYVDSFTYAYSKITGNQTRGPWELKKDFVNIEANKQVYEIPAGREINEVLWITPPSIDHALYSYYGMGGMGGMGSGEFGGAQIGYGDGGGGGYGTGGFYIAPAFDILLRNQDFNLKQRMFRGDLTYKVTAGPNGTRLLHLFSVPGSKIGFGVGDEVSIRNCKVWYHYYDTTSENVGQCRLENSDIIKLPNEVPLSKIDYCDLNDPTKIWVRKYFVAKCKVGLGRVRGKFSGQLKIGEADATMDYQDLINEGNKEMENLITKLSERLLNLTTLKQLERQGNEAENLNKALKFRPLGIYAI